MNFSTLFISFILFRWWLFLTYIFTAYKVEWCSTVNINLKDVLQIVDRSSVEAVYMYTY